MRILALGTLQDVHTGIIIAQVTFMKSLHDGIYGGSGASATEINECMTMAINREWQMQHPVIDLIGKWPAHLLKFLIITIKHKAIHLKYLKFLDPCIFWLSRSSTWQSCPSNESELVALILKRFSASLYFLLDDC